MSKKLTADKLMINGQPVDKLLNKVKLSEKKMSWGEAIKLSDEKKAKEKLKNG